jgi:peptide/nickel transport system ATP-binding protein
MGDTQNQDDVLLHVEDLVFHFHTDEGTVRALNGVTFDIQRGETLGLVGESGSGKSVTANSILRLVPEPPGKIVAGKIQYFRDAGNGEASAVDIAGLKPRSRAMRNIRGNEIAMVFQEPMTAFSPVHTIGNQISEAILLHQDVTKAEAIEISVQMLERVGISSPEQRVNEYPHQFSGGMRQRAMIAMALSCRPSLLIADEPTTALDVTVQAQILELIGDLKRDFDMSVMYITHDLGVIAETSDNVGVMYSGRIVEYASVDEIFHNPLHPYTEALLHSIASAEQDPDQPLATIRGVVPPPYARIPGCPFAPRCDKARGECGEGECPDMVEISPGHMVRCALYG